MRHVSTKSGRPAAALALLLFSVPAVAQIVNGSFEDTPNHPNAWMLGAGARKVFKTALQVLSEALRVVPIERDVITGVACNLVPLSYYPLH